MDALIACEMLRDELELAMEECGVRPPVVWMEKGLHEYPDRLRRALQEEIDRLSPSCEHILLALAYCGGALDGLGSQDAALVAPRFDDCVRMLLSLEPGRRDYADCHCLYLTGQWLCSDCYLLREFEGYVERYGPKKARRIQQAMLCNYRGYRMIDTGAYSLADYRAAAQADAETLGLAYGEQRGSIRILKKLLLGDWDEEFCVLPPGSCFRQSQFLRC